MTPYHYIAIAWACAVTGAAVAHWLLRERWTRTLLAVLLAPLAGVVWAWGLLRSHADDEHPADEHLGRDDGRATPPRTLPTSHTTPEDYHEIDPHPGPDADLVDRVDWYRKRTDEKRGL